MDRNSRRDSGSSPAPVCRVGGKFITKFTTNGVLVTALLSDVNWEFIDTVTEISQNDANRLLYEEDYQTLIEALDQFVSNYSCDMVMATPSQHRADQVVILPTPDAVLAKETLDDAKQSLLEIACVLFS